ncbi:MAG TPA: flagellar biosynthesis regulator FlaF [Paracoccaceae bacterium]|nr:flagellar biosynthesis regulator FlaF [Paracoccaceae bacterium]
MYQTGYAEVLDDAGAMARSHERRALDRAIELLAAAEERGRRSREAIDALLFVDRLWTALLQDLASSENGLPGELRASLISIGIWVLKEVELIRREESDNFAGLIEIFTNIRSGLK